MSSSWDDYKRSVIPNKTNKLIEKSLESPRVIKNRENNRLIKNKEFLSSLDYRNYNISIANAGVQRKFKSEASIDLHFTVDIKNSSNNDLNNILETFFSKCILYGFSCVTVITGKGKGILKNSVILWLQNNSQFVKKYFEIKDSKKECGSLGIYLRSLDKIYNNQK